MKKNILSILLSGLLLIGAAVMDVMAADAPSKSRAGLYNRTPVEKASSLPGTEASSLYAPLRANPTTDPGAPGLDEGIETATPIGEIPGVILFGAAMAYLGFVFVRKQRELRVKN